MITHIVDFCKGATLHASNYFAFESYTIGKKMEMTTTQFFFICEKLENRINVP